MALLLRAKLYRVTQIRWVDIPKRKLAGLKLTPAEKKGWNALLRFNDDADRVTLFTGKPGCYKLAIKVEATCRTSSERVPSFGVCCRLSSVACSNTACHAHTSNRVRSNPRSAFQRSPRSASSSLWVSAEIGLGM